jgi:iron complex outermembrane recepter protein
MKMTCALVVAGVATLIYSSSLLSAESEVAPPDLLPEVIVTAQKREESLLKVPIAVSALSQKQLTDQGVVSLADLGSSVPDLVMKPAGYNDGIQVSLRGISDTDANEGGNPAVATYIDGIYVGRTQGLGGAMYDLQRVEVLRGPQGTLYGRNSTGGNINVITADPQPTFGAAVDLSYGNYSDILIHGMVNVPVTDTLAIRAAVMSHDSNGFYNTLGSTERGYGAANDHAGRLTILWQPTDSFQWRLSGDDYVSNGTPGTLIVTGPNGKPVNGLSPLDQPTIDHLEPSDHLNNASVRSKMDWSFADHWSLSYIAGYQDLNFAAQVGLGPNVADSLRRDPFESYSQELDLTFNSSKLNNTFGATYFHQVTSSPDAYRFIPLGLSFGLPQADRVKTEAWGVFDQATYSVMDSLRMIAGVRYSSETQHAYGALSNFCPIALYANEPLSALGKLFGPGCFTSTVIPAAGTWSNVNWKTGLEYDISDTTSSYATATTGFKSGGANIGFNTPVPNFGPEKVINYELGLKTRLMDGRVRLNSALFFENYTAIQVTQVVSFNTITQNAGGAHIYGIENEGQWRTTKHDEVSGFLNYIHATYTQYANAVDAVDGTNYASLAGKYLPNSPLVSLKVQYLHDFDLPNGGTLTPTVWTNWQSKNYLREFNLPIDTVGSYGKTNALITYSDPSRHWKLQAYVYNVENHIERDYGAAFLGSYASGYDAPRTYGARVSYQY